MTNKIKYRFGIFGLVLILFIIGFTLYSKTYSVIEGEVRFPANNWPIQTICLINSSTKEEKCVDNYHFPDFSLKVKPSKYYIYSKINKEKNDSRWNDLLDFNAFYTEYSKANCVPLPLDKSEADKCNQIKENNKPIQINARRGEIIKGINFDWENGNFYDSIVSK